MSGFPQAKVVESPLTDTSLYGRSWPSLCKNAKVAYIEERDFFGAAT
jgi:hypothetical protein